MVTPQGFLMVFVGVVACFMGYSMFKSMLPLWGFILGGWIAMTFAPNFITVEPNQQLFMIIAAFIIGGIIGASIATPLYYVIIFLSGASLGALVAVIMGAWIDMGGITNFRDLREFSSMSFAFPPQITSITQLVLIIIFGGILGLLALNFQKFMITASSAFLGAAALVAGLSAVITNSVPTMGASVLLMVAWMLIGMIGLFVQFRIMGDET